RWVNHKLRGYIGAVTSRQINGNLRGDLRFQCRRSLDSGMPFLSLEAKQSLVIFKNLEVVPGLFRQNGIDHRRDPPAIELTIGETRAQHFACEDRKSTRLNSSHVSIS